MASLTLKNTALILGSMLIGGALTAALYARLTPVDAAAPAAEQQRKVLFWYDPMYPNTRFDKPGKSPFMDMDLVPKYADEESAAAGAPGVRIDPTQTQNLGVKTAAVTRGPLRYAQTFPANISYNEYQYVIMQARAAGFINKVYPLTVGDKVKQGTPLLELTIPDWVEAQSEYLLLQETGAIRYAGRGDPRASTSRRNAGRRYPPPESHAQDPDPLHPQGAHRRGDHRLRSARRNEHR